MEAKNRQNNSNIISNKILNLVFTEYLQNAAEFIALKYQSIYNNLKGNFKFGILIISAIHVCWCLNLINPMRGTFFFT